jgi:hypothetical protein
MHACVQQPAARESVRDLERQYFSGDRDKDRRDDDRREGGGRMGGRLGGRLDLDARPSARFEPYSRRRDDDGWGGGGMRMDRMPRGDRGGDRRSGGLGGERWGGRGRGGGRREPREKRAPQSAEDLDKAMESYWKDSVSRPDWT